MTITSISQHVGLISLRVPQMNDAIPFWSSISTLLWCQVTWRIALLVAEDDMMMKDDDDRPSSLG